MYNFSKSQVCEVHCSWVICQNAPRTIYKAQYADAQKKSRIDFCGPLAMKALTFPSSACVLKHKYLFSYLNCSNCQKWKNQRKQLCYGEMLVSRQGDNFENSRCCMFNTKDDIELETCEKIHIVRCCYTW